MLWQIFDTFQDLHFYKLIQKVQLHPLNIVCAISSCSSLSSFLVNSMHETLSSDIKSVIFSNAGLSDLFPKIILSVSDFIENSFLETFSISFNNIFIFSSFVFFSSDNFRRNIHFSFFDLILRNILCYRKGKIFHF